MSRFTRVKNLSPWRKLALIFWDPPGDPSVYGWYELDVTKAQKFLEQINATSDVKVTLTHYFARAIGVLIARYPMINGIIKWGTIYLREHVDLFLQVAVPGDGGKRGDQLSGAVIRDIDKKSVTEIAAELVRQADDIRNDRDENFGKQFTLARFLPVFLLRRVVRGLTFFMFNLGFSSKMLGIPEDPFGSAMLTSVGSLNAPPGLAPLVPNSRCPLLLCLGRVEKRPWVVDDRVAVRPVVKFTMTFDHRFMDGLMASKMFGNFMDILYHPEKHL